VLLEKSGERFRLVLGADAEMAARMEPAGPHLNGGN
jgi:hypothetical protein